MFKIMKIEIDFQSTNRFLMSSGFVLVTMSIIVGYSFFNLLLTQYSPDKLGLAIFLGITFLGYLLIGCNAVQKGYNGLKEFEGLEKKFKFENMVNQILDQDLKLIDIKLKQLEYNEKLRSLKEIDRSKSFRIQELNEVRYRDIQNVVAQALDPNFYENTYPEIVKNITKKSKEIKNKKAS